MLVGGNDAQDHAIAPVRLHQALDQHEYPVLESVFFPEQLGEARLTRFIDHVIDQSGNSFDPVFYMSKPVARTDLDAWVIANPRDLAAGFRCRHDEGVAFPPDPDCGRHRLPGLSERRKGQEPLVAKGEQVVLVSHQHAPLNVHCRNAIERRCGRHRRGRHCITIAYDEDGGTS
ncbi:MAG: hypothetical protein WKF63_00785 [Thermomicrobiales bacterium]